MKRLFCPRCPDSTTGWRTSGSSSALWPSRSSWPRPRKMACRRARAPQAHPHQSRTGARQPRSQAQKPGGAGLPVQEVPRQDARGRILGDERGLGVQAMARRGVHRQGSRGAKLQTACARLRGRRGSARQEDRRACDGRQPDRKESA